MDRILCCFGDKRCEIVAHIPRINSSAMVANIVYTLKASNFILPEYHECGTNVKCIHLIKGVSYVIKLRLSDEYVLNSDVHLTRGLNAMHPNMFPRQLAPKTSWFKLDQLASGYKSIITPILVL